MNNSSHGHILGASAAGYALAGHKVLPLKQGQKAPSTRHGLKDATADLDEIARYWRKYPDDNIGIVPNLGEYVIDVDDHSAFGALIAELGELPSDCPVAETQRGGLHLWVSYAGGALRGALAPGVDIKCHTGYLVAPPSSVNGRIYRWRRPLNGQPPTAGAWTARALKPATAGQRCAAVSSRDFAHPGTNPAYTRVAIADELRRLATAAAGDRNRTLYPVACNVFEFVKGGHADKQAAWTELARIADALGLPETEIRTTLRSAWNHVGPRRVPTR